MRLPAIRIAVLFCTFLYPGAALLAQDACGPTESRKAAKLFAQATAQGKLTPQDRINLLNQSLQADADCIECLFAKARLQYQMAYERNSNPDPASKTFKEVTSRCPAYHADAWYYQGLIAYANQDYEGATAALEAFIDFNPARGITSRDHAVKLRDADAMLPEAKFYAEFYANPVSFNPAPVQGVNTAADEYLPMLSPDNEFLYFTRKSMLKAKGDIYAREVEEFMQSFRKTGQSHFDTPEALPPPFNVGDNYGGVSISLDNKEMFVTVCKPATPSYKNCDLYVTRYERTTDKDGKTIFIWSGLENLGPNVNTPDGWEAQPTLSADGNTLFFATIRASTTPDKDGNPSIDIYYTERQADGTWSVAKPLPGPINTPGNDKSPFLHTDSRTLYFSSNGRPGAGGYDIYYSRQDENGKWLEPKNIGYPINTPQDEHGLIVSADGREAYFASAGKDRSRGLDIFTFELPKNARPQKVLILKGEVQTAQGGVPADARIEVKYAGTNETQRFGVDGQDGTYAAVVNLKAGQEALVSVKSDADLLAFNSRVFTLEDTLSAVKGLTMAVDEVREGTTYKMNDIRFATNSAELDKASMRILDEFVSYLIDHPTLKISIEGHTDNIGDPKKNLALSTDRAFEVFGYLQEMGVDFNRMSFKGFGDTRPLAPNTNAENRALNRRTEFRITSR